MYVTYPQNLGASKGFAPTRAGPTGGLKAAPRPPAFWAPLLTNPGSATDLELLQYELLKAECPASLFIKVYQKLVTMPRHRILIFM